VIYVVVKVLNIEGFMRLNAAVRELIVHCTREPDETS
jgi:hypothetical protein